MSVSHILALQSGWTWNTIQGSILLGEVIREDALTSVNLATIIRLAMAENIKLHITSMQGARLEKEFGADWYWKLDDRAQLIQAKKLEVAARNDLMKYTIDVAQLNQLMVQANLMSAKLELRVEPAYVFYNSLIQGNYPVEDYGCTAVPAGVVLKMLEDSGRINQQTASILLSELISHMVPWHTLLD